MSYKILFTLTGTLLINSGCVSTLTILTKTEIGARSATESQVIRRALLSLSLTCNAGILFDGRILWLEFYCKKGDTYAGSESDINESYGDHEKYQNDKLIWNAKRRCDDFRRLNMTSRIWWRPTNFMKSTKADLDTLQKLFSGGDQEILSDKQVPDLKISWATSSYRAWRNTTWRSRWNIARNVVNAEWNLTQLKY